MSDAPRRIVRAWLESLTTGVVELDRDWPGEAPPRITLGEQCPAPDALAPAPGLVTGRAYGYYVNEGKITFVLPLEHGCAVDPLNDTVYLAGDFNGWQAAVGKEAWRLHYQPDPAIFELRTRGRLSTSSSLMSWAA